MSFDKRGQLTIFVIIAIIIVAGIVIYFLFRERVIAPSGISSDLMPVFNYYDECIKQETMAAIELAGSQGGYVEVPDYFAGSEYAPFSSELNFLGFPVPYWYYISGNGLIKEQMPSKGDIERGIAEYVEERVNGCDFDSFYAQGFSVEFGEPSVRVNLEDENVNVIVDSELVVSKEKDSARRERHEVGLNSKLGKFYNIAKKIYEKERKEGVFDSYAEDVLRLYAPVDGVEISCSGKIWKTRDVIEELKSGLEANIGAIKFKGDYYKLNDEKDKYFVIDLGEDIDEQINLVYSRDMASKVEIVGEGVDEELMIALPVGNQEGLGVMGFCYSPYHFVYDVNFPILVQIYNNNELFQFPFVVIVDNNVAREAVFSELEGEEDEFDLCEFKTQELEINLYDINLNSVDANISYQCFNQRCRLGESANGKFIGKAPACLNGQLLVRKEGYADKKEVFSSSKESFIDVVLDKEYEIEIELKVGGKQLRGTALINFVGSNGKTVSTALPDVSKIKLSEGLYELSAYVYDNSSIVIPASTKVQCQEVPRSGIFGFFGAKKEECYDITIPETKIELALRGGGKGEEYITESQLERGKIVINVDELPLPKSLEELQYNYAAFERMGVVIE